MNRQKILASALCTGLLLSVALSGCGNEESTPDKAVVTSAVTSTAIATATASATEAVKTEIVTEKLTEATNAEVFTPDYNYDMQENDDSPQLCTLNVDGKAYTSYIGDIVNYVFYLKTPEALEDFQAVTNYDSSMLDIVNTSTAEMFPVAGEGVVCNTEMQNVVKFNAVNLSGMDFTKGGNLISLKFRVIDSGSVAISTTLEYMDSVKSEPYVTDYKIIGDIDYSEEIIL